MLWVRRRCRRRRLLPTPLHEQAAALLAWPGAPPVQQLARKQLCAASTSHGCNSRLDSTRVAAALGGCLARLAMAPYRRHGCCCCCCYIALEWLAFLIRQSGPPPRNAEVVVAPAAVHIPTVQASTRCCRHECCPCCGVLLLALRLLCQSAVQGGVCGSLGMLQVTQCFRTCCGARPCLHNVSCLHRLPLPVAAGGAAQGLLRVCPELLGGQGRRLHWRAQVRLWRSFVCMPGSARCRQ